MSNNAEYAKRTLIYYLNQAIGGLDADNYVEIEGIVDSIIAAAQEPKSTVQLTTEDYAKFKRADLNSIDNVTIVLPLNEYRTLKHEAHKYKKMVDILNEVIKVVVDKSNNKEEETFTATVDGQLLLHYLMRYVHKLRNDKGEVIYDEWEYNPDKVSLIIK